MTRMFGQLGDRLLAVLVPERTAHADYCVTRCCNTQCTWIKRCCNNGGVMTCGKCYQ